MYQQIANIKHWLTLSMPQLRSQSEDPNNYITRDEVDKLLQTQEKHFMDLLKVQEDSFKSCLQAIMDSTNKRLDDFIVSTTTKLQSAKESLEFTQNKTDTDHKDMITKLSWLKERSNSHDKITNTVSVDMKQVQKDLDYLENQSRRNNIRIDGVKEKTGENWVQTELLVKEILATKLNIDAKRVEIERAHRVGKKEDGANRPRTIVAKMLRYKDRANILKNAHKLKGTDIVINEDVSDSIQSKRKELLPKLHEAKKQGKIAYFTLDRLVIKDRPPEKAGMDGAEGDVSGLVSELNTNNK